MAAAAPAMNTGDWISAVLALVQIAAIIIGALWAYYKFFKGRIFHRRAEPTVEGALVGDGSSSAVLAKLSLKNTGSTDVPLRVTLLTLSSHRSYEEKNGHPRWHAISRAHAFCNDEGERDHDAVESQETITDEVLIPIPEWARREDVLAYRIICQVYERREKGGGICWTTKAIVPVQRDKATESQYRRFHEDEALPEYLPNEPHHADRVLREPVVRQRPSSEAEIEEAERD